MFSEVICLVKITGQKIILADWIVSYPACETIVGQEAHELLSRHLVHGHNPSGIRKQQSELKRRYLGIKIRIISYILESLSGCCYVSTSH